MESMADSFRSGFEVRRSNGATRSSASFQGCSVFEMRGRRAGFCCPVHRRPPALLSWLLSKRLDGRLHLDDGRGSKAAVWKLALIVLRRQTTDPWMNAIEGRVFVERGSTVRGRQRALQQLRIWAFPGPGQPAGRPVSPCNCTSPKATRITRSPRPSQPPCPTPSSSSTGGEARYSTDAPSTSSRRSSAMNFAPPGGLIL